MIDTAEAVRLPLPDFDCNLLAGARGLPRLLTAERNPGVDAINIFPVFAGHFACFCAVDFRVSAGQLDFCGGFDSRQLH